jgi:tRNA1Val (adenine37-N6)-methyltransferase
MSFTYEYSQPDDYHFSLDSIEMPLKVAEYLKEQYSGKDMKAWQCLDLCAGCGVLGFELMFHLPEIQKMDFLEVQDTYLPHFAKNRELALAKAQSLLPKLRVAGQSHDEPKYEFLNLNYESLMVPQFQHKYRLILCNPPYFLPEQGKHSPSDFKNRCRFFLDSTFEQLIESIQQSLAMDGEAFLLLRDLEDHGLDLLADLQKLIRGKLKCENLCMIRGTFLLKLYR